MIIDCIGCLHGHLPKLDGGDLLIVTGDLTSCDDSLEHVQFILWLDRQNYTRKIFISGNHDNHTMDYEIGSNDRYPNIEYLCDSGIEFEGLKIWGSPWSHRFIGINPKCTAFTYRDETWFYDEKVSKIPHDTDILVTHSPAYGILDGIPNEDGTLYHAGSKALQGWLEYVHRPRLHVFSHIHEAYGQTERFPSNNDQMMISVNCSIMNEKYKPVNAPVRIIL